MQFFLSFECSLRRGRREGRDGLTFELGERVFEGETVPGVERGSSGSEGTERDGGRRGRGVLDRFLFVFGGVRGDVMRLPEIKSGRVSLSLMGSWRWSEIRVSGTREGRESAG